LAGKPDTLTVMNEVFKFITNNGGTVILSGTSTEVMQPVVGKPYHNLCQSVH
jgi:hypothetical protein